jgi:cobalt/nickel transport system permease protein
LAQLHTALLLTSITTKEQLLAALRSFGLPLVFVEILSIMMRYLSIFQTEAESLLRARACRSVALPNSGLKAGGSVFWRAEVSGQMVGNLMLRSFERGERVYQAMLARGYNGIPLQVETQKVTNKEKGLLLFGLASLSFVIIFGILIY